MAQQTKHEIEIEILPDGKIKSTVKGVAGPSCSDLTKWLEQLGEVESEGHTDDWRKPNQAVIVGRAGTNG